MVNTKEKLEKRFPAVVARIINPYRVVINRGIEQDIKLGQRFLVYSLSNEEILDPITNESLGYLEIVKGTGKVIHVQEKMSIIESDKTETSNRTITKKSSLYSFLGDAVEEIASPQQVPFDSVQVGDKAKPV
jgi:hypothetical protein